MAVQQKIFLGQLITDSVRKMASDIAFECACEDFENDCNSEKENQQECQPEIASNELLEE